MFIYICVICAVWLVYANTCIQVYSWFMQIHVYRPVHMYMHAHVLLFCLPQVNPKLVVNHFTMANLLAARVRLGIGVAEC